MAILEHEPISGLRFGQQLQAARRSRKVSQTALAEELGVNVGTISSWENGHTAPDIHQYRQIVLLLDLDYMADVRGLGSPCTPVSAGQAA